MNILIEIFKDLGTFFRYASGVDTSLNLNDLYASGLTAKKRISAILSLEVFDALCKEDNESPLYEPFRSAIANLVMSSETIFNSLKMRKAGVDTYKYEHEAMKRSYTEAYSASMDTILQQFMNTENQSPSLLWKNSRYYQTLSSCKIQSADEFDNIYPIDSSYLFFFRLVPLQKESLDERLNAYYQKINEENRTSLESALNLALAKKTVAKSLRRFDILEFPPTIRNLFDESHASRAGKDENDAAMNLANRLDSEAETLIGNADALLSSNVTADFSSYSAYNLPADKIIMMP